MLEDFVILWNVSLLVITAIIASRIMSGMVSLLPMLAIDCFVRAILSSYTPSNR